MNEARPFASLSSGLLARKGAAKPAMRPQGYQQTATASRISAGTTWATSPVEDADAEDLPEHVPSSIAALTPAPKLPRQDDEPEVVAQQRAIAETFEPEEAEAEAAEPSRSPRSKRPRPCRCASRRPAAGRAAAEAPPDRRQPGPQGRLHAAARRRAPSAPSPRLRGHRPLGAADRAERARRAARRHSRNRGAGRAGARAKAKRS